MQKIWINCPYCTWRFNELTQVRLHKLSAHRELAWDAYIDEEKDVSFAAVARQGMIGFEHEGRD